MSRCYLLSVASRTCPKLRRIWWGPGCIHHGVTTKCRTGRGLGNTCRRPNSNLGWRIILNVGGEEIARDRVRTAQESALELVEVIPPAERDAILAEAKAKASIPQTGKEGGSASQIKLTSYEGSKGLSAQYVFLVGLHERELPKDAARVTDLEICRFVVGLTRTKKKCTVLIAGRFGNVVKQPSVFLSWIDNRSYNRLFVDAAYWQRV